MVTRIDTVSKGSFTTADGVGKRVRCLAVSSFDTSTVLVAGVSAGVQIDGSISGVSSYTPVTKEIWALAGTLWVSGPTVLTIESMTNRVFGPIDVSGGANTAGQILIPLPYCEFGHFRASAGAYLALRTVPATRVGGALTVVDI